MTTALGGGFLSYIKYTVEGKVILSINWEEKGSDALLRFSIQDTGLGIRKEDMGKLFSEYTQLGPRSNDKIEGTGLGLPITKKLAEMMEGSITAESEFGKGSTFTVTLVQGLPLHGERPGSVPVIGEDTAEKLRQFRYISPKTEKTVEFSWMPYGRVLVVDDMPVNLLVAKGLFKPYGLNVETAASGEEAIEKIKAGYDQFSLIFMDHLMPGMDGIETVRIIRAWEEERNKKNSVPPKSGMIPAESRIPIIALTANALTGRIEMFLSRGFNGFLAKPIDIIQLDAVLNQWIRDRQDPETLRQAEDDKAGKDEREKSEKSTAPIPDVKPAVNEPEVGESAVSSIPGIDMEQGIALSGGTASIYHEVLSIYREDIEKRMPMFQTVPDADNLRPFIIQVHSLKSASAAIGAAEVSALAAGLEKAGNAGDLECIKRQLPVLSGLLISLIGGIRTWEKGNGERSH